jgi:hypothetical protein
MSRKKFNWPAKFLCLSFYPLWKNFFKDQKQRHYMSPVTLALYYDLAVNKRAGRELFAGTRNVRELLRE